MRFVPSLAIETFFLCIYIKFLPIDYMMGYQPRRNSHGKEKESIHSCSNLSTHRCASL